MFERFLNQFRNYIIGGLLIAVGVTSLGWYVTAANLDACASGRKADKAAYEKAQADAEVLWMKAIKKKEDEYEKKAKKADEAYDALSTKYRDAVRVYAAAQSKARSTAAAAQGGSPESAYGPGEDTELPIVQVVVSTEDLMTCAENTARLVIARDWALGLNK